MSCLGRMGSLPRIQLWMYRSRRRGSTSLLSIKRLALRLQVHAAEVVVELSCSRGLNDRRLNEGDMGLRWVNVNSFYFVGELTITNSLRHIFCHRDAFPSSSSSHGGYIDPNNHTCSFIIFPSFPCLIFHIFHPISSQITP